jgi:integrase
MDIKNDKLMKIFIQNRELKPNTIKRYYHALTLYSNFLNKPPSEWITEAEDEEEERLRMRRRKIKSYQLDFRDFLHLKDYSQQTVSTIMISVRSFYKEFDIEQPRMKIKKGDKEEKLEDIPGKEEIKIALKYANLKYKAIILLMSSSGMGSSEIRSLSYSHLLESLQEYIEIPKIGMVSIDILTDLLSRNESKLIVPTWKITRIKTGKGYVTFSTPESITAIIDYLRIDPPLHRESPLFRKQYRDKSITDAAFFKQFFDLNRKCGFGKPDRQAYFRSHGLRKYFTNVLFHKGISQLRIDWLLAHKINDTTESYFKRDINALKIQYIKCIPSLSIEDVEVHDLKSPEFIKVESELERTKKRLNIVERAIENQNFVDKLPPKEDPIE